MQVYIEYVVANNLLINALLLTLTLKFNRYKINKLAIFFASSLGCIYAIFLPLFDVLNIIIFKLVLACIMVLAVMGKCSKKRYFTVLAIFLIETFFLGGLTLGLQSIFGIDDAKLNKSLIPFFVGMGGLVLLAGQKLLHKYIILAKRKNLYTGYVEISANGKVVRCLAYYDSGNKLYYDNKPTIIIDKSIADKLYNETQLSEIKTNTSISTVLGQKNLKVFALDYLKIEGSKDKNYGIMAAISDCLSGNYKILMHCDI